MRGLLSGDLGWGWRREDGSGCELVARVREWGWRWPGEGLAWRLASVASERAEAR